MRVLAVVCVAAFGASVAMAAAAVSLSMLTGARSGGAVPGITVAGVLGAVAGGWGSGGLMAWLDVTLTRLSARGAGPGVGGDRAG